MKLRRLAESLNLSKAEQRIVLALLALLIVGASARLWSQSSFMRSGATVVRSPRAATVTIDLNAASWHDLVVLPGIGPKRAEQIVGLRSELPGQRFSDLQQLTQIRGISTRTVDGIRPYVTLGQPEEQR